MTTLHCVGAMREMRDLFEMVFVVKRTNYAYTFMRLPND